VGGIGDRGGERRFQPLGRDFLAVLRLLRAHRFPSAPDSPPLPTAEGMPPRGSQRPDEGDRRSGGVDRNAPGRFRQALNRPDSGQAGHGPWEQVLI
jgi:hypothetical protein